MICCVAHGGQYGDPRKEGTLLHAMIVEARKGWGGAPFHSADIDEALHRRRFWGNNPPPTTRRTINRNCSQRPDIFRHTGKDEYKLLPQWQ
jgi:hypothetical protein